jgi:iron complex transport system permease protein
MLLLVVALMVAAIVGLDLGSTRTSLSRLAAVLFGQGYWFDNVLILDMRLPRVLMAMLVGAGLATAGVVLQGITRNDLASPGTIGVNGGSGLGMVSILLFSPTIAATMPMLLPLGAVVGALLTTTLVFALSYRHGIVLPSRLLLVGIAIGFGAQAAMLMISLRMGYVEYNYVVAWMAGSLASADWKLVRILAPCCAILIPAVWCRARVLNVLGLGDQIATNLGVSVVRERVMLLGLATVLTSACVAIGGHISFLGLVAPHLARRLVGSNHVSLFPAAALCSAILLLVADALGRHMFAPIEVPSGVLVGVLGGIYFLYLLARTNN